MHVVPCKSAALATVRACYHRCHTESSLVRALVSLCISKLKMLLRMDPLPRIASNSGVDFLPTRLVSRESSGVLCLAMVCSFPCRHI